MKDKIPSGGWLGPPSTVGLEPLATVTTSKRGKWIWRKNNLSEKQVKKHKQFNKAMKKADSKGKWKFKW